MSRQKLCVIFGGVTPEHDVSLRSAASVLRNISPERYEVYAVGITRDGRWLYCEDVRPETLEDGSWQMSSIVPVIISPDRSVHGLTIYGGDGVRHVTLDCVFHVMHGCNGEDGSMQGLFELAGLPYVGCDVLSSAASMDKATTKILTDRIGIRQAGYVTVFRSELQNDIDAVIKQIEGAFAYPVFVKPSATGSSVGAAKAKDRAQLVAALHDAARFDVKIIVEEYIDGYEIEVAVLGNDNPVASCCGQINPCREFYSYEAKYLDNASETLIPARIPAETADFVRNNAVRIYKNLGCSGLSRVDFFVRKSDGEVIFNEINTIPGFTSISMYAKLFAHDGIPFPELIDRLVALAVERQRETAHG